MKREPCDILNAHWTYEFAQAALSVDRNAIISVRDWAPAILKQLPDPYRFIRLLMAAHVYWKGRVFTVNSPYMKKVVERWTRHQTTLIPNGLADAAFDQRAQWKHDDGSQSIIAINRGFFERKNLPTLLRAFAELRKDLPELRLKLVGRGSEPNGIGQQWAIKEQLDGGVDFLGIRPFDEVQELLVQSSLLVHPSHEESFGMVLLEAMAKGVPVVGGVKSGAVPWVLNQGDAGVLVDVKKPGPMLDAIKRLLMDEATWTSYSTRGYAHAYSTFRMSGVAEKYYGCYLSQKGVA